ncbi:TetR/AcrR family transcriptional regulator [Streptomyces sp. UH6]|uniref:TetR/AcrR family transcriptional regulator n=1 Tax=Streptomyces sp. UH6 TaxID=2748379 RepID=UPI0015D46E6C|nr:TetR family transcriptional regulator [Streptomyces sp. UH6]NYV72775.1 TetR/AcrR family transcriptional regulator [Streptomyces sp. UH6]
MPIFVDHEERREQIVTAATQVLGELGFAKFTLRAVGKRMGGSVTLVTHYFSNRDALLDALLERTLSDARNQQDELMSITDPHERLRATIEYFLPLNEENMRIERARVALASQRGVEPSVAEHMDQIDPGMRALVRVALAEFIPADQLEETVDLIRLWTAGVVLSAIEHPETWTQERQLVALEQFMRRMNLPTLTA